MGIDEVQKLASEVLAGAEVADWKAAAHEFAKWLADLQAKVGDLTGRAAAGDAAVQKHDDLSAQVDALQQQNQSLKTAAQAVVGSVVQTTAGLQIAPNSEGNFASLHELSKQESA